ncbi:MAG: hypothetical protein AB1626_02815 [Candidatus Micrarchaeota archaeon]
MQERQLKGVISFVLVLLLVAPLSTMHALADSASAQTALAARKAVSLEKRYYLEIALKESLHQVLASAQGADRRQVVADAARKLQEWEKHAEKAFAEEGAAVDAWFGAVGEDELQRLREQMLADKRLAKPSAAHDFSQYGVGWKGELLLLSEAFLDAAPSGGAVISRNGLAFVPEAGALHGELFCFGASILFPREGLAAIAIAPEGFG